MLQKSEVDLIQNKYHEITRHYKESYLETVKPERRTCQPNFEDTITQAYRSLTPGLHKAKKTKYCLCACRPHNQRLEIVTSKFDTLF